VTMDGGELLLGTTSPVLLCLGYLGGLEPLYQRQEPEQPLEANDRQFVSEGALWLADLYGVVARRVG
jgi:hypothetical protein